MINIKKQKLRLTLVFQIFLTAQLIVSSVLAADFDSVDKENLKIYTSQGFNINSLLRRRIPLETIKDKLDLTIAKTCKTLIDNNAEYIPQIQVIPGTLMRPVDFKFQHLIQQSLKEKAQAYTQLVYRGVKDCDYLFDENDKPLKYFLEKGFMSTSTDEKVAQRFTKFENDSDDNNSLAGCLMRIQGSSGKAIAEATGNYNKEEEVLFPQNTLFEIASFKKNGEQKVFELKEVQSDELVKENNQKQFLTATKIFYQDMTEKFSKKLSVEAEAVCKEAYRFFTQNPDIRSKDAAHPEYDLNNRKLNPADYAADE